MAQVLDNVGLSGKILLDFVEEPKYGMVALLGAIGGTIITHGEMEYGNFNLLIVPHGGVEVDIAVVDNGINIDSPNPDEFDEIIYGQPNVPMTKLFIEKNRIITKPYRNEGIFLNKNQLIYIKSYNGKCSVRVNGLAVVSRTIDTAYPF